MKKRRVFVAGSTGAVGRTVVRLAAEAGLDVLAHARPKPGREGAHVFELGETRALDAALRSRTTVMQLVGTMRKRFDGGDSYASSDVGTTRLLVEAAQRVGVDHVVLLSSAGASRWMGPYLAAKAEAEALVRASGVPFTIVRPGFFEGEGHAAPPLSGAVSSVLGAWSFRPIAVADVARALLRIAVERAPLGRVVEGRELHALARELDR